GFNPVVVGAPLRVLEPAEEEETGRRGRGQTAEAGREMVQLKCPGCSRVVSVPAPQPGSEQQVVKCPSCGQRIIGPPVPDAPVPLDAEGQRGVDTIGIVTVHDGPSLSPGEIIAPAVGNDSNDPNYHNNYQDPDAFLRAGGRRGRQYVPLTDGTYFIN